MKLLIINGPNLNLLGIREPQIYGTQGYEALKTLIAQTAEDLQVEAEVFQSNSEGALIDRLCATLSDGTDAIIINPAAYTHYSYALHDALAALSVPKIEVHLSNIHKREEFRRRSVTAPACDAQLAGLGMRGYALAMAAARELVLERQAE